MLSLLKYFIFIIFSATEGKIHHHKNRPDQSLYYGSYYNGPVCTPSAPIQHPRTVEEVVAIVRTAIATGTTVKALGMRHSATDIICTAGIPVDMTGIGGMTINKPGLSVTVGAGVHLYELVVFLKQNGRGLQNLPAFGNLTIGGAIGTEAYGTSVKFAASISEQVIGVTIVDGQGVIRVISDSTELKGFRVHLGLLGIIVSVTLRTEPFYKLRLQNYITHESLLYDGSLDELLKAADRIALFWFPQYNQVVVANWTPVDVNTPGEATGGGVSVPSTFNSIFDPALNAAHALDSFNPKLAFKILSLLESYVWTFPEFPPPDRANITINQNPTVGFYYDMLLSTCDDHGVEQCLWFHDPNNITFTENEFGFDVKNVPVVTRTLKDILLKYPAAFPIWGIEIRFSAPSQTYMSSAYGKHVCHFEFYMSRPADQYETASAGLAAYQTFLQSIVFQHGAKSHWGKSGLAYHSTYILKHSVDPAAKIGFLNLMNKYDPNGIFLNDFGHRFRGTGTKSNIDPQTTHCALLENCFCSFDSDCAVGQKCDTIKGYPQFHSCINPLVQN